MDVFFFTTRLNKDDIVYNKLFFVFYNDDIFSSTSIMVLEDYNFLGMHMFR
jgi:hypothetical protein